MGCGSETSINVKKKQRKRKAGKQRKEMNKNR